MKTGARELLRFIERRGIPAALVTSTRRSTAEEKLERNQLLDHFQFLVCGGEAPRGKPEPDPYLFAASGLAINPAACWALEDSANGVRAAHSAGCTVYQVPDLVPPSPEIRELGHRIVDSLHDVLAALERL